MATSAVNRTSNSQLTTIVKGSSLAFMGEMSRAAFNVFYGLFAARAVAAHELGLFFLSLTVVQILMMVSLLGLQRGVIRYIPIYLSQNDQRGAIETIRSALFATALASVSITILLYFFADVISTHIFQKPELRMTLKWMSLALPPSALSMICYGVLQGFLDIRKKIIIEIFVTLGLQVALTIAFFALGFGGISLMAAFVIARFAGFLMVCKEILPYLQQAKVNQFTSYQYDSKALFAFSLPLLLTTIFHFLLGQNEIVIMGLYLAADEIAIYTVALKISLIGAVILRSFTMIFAPMISELATKQDTDQLARLYATVSKWTLMLVIPWFVCTFFLLDHILMYIGPSYVAGAAALLILCCGQVIHSASGTVGTLLTMSGYSRLALYNSLVFLILSLTLNFILTPRIGIEGAALSNALTYVLANILMLVEAWIILQMTPFCSEYFKPALAAVASFLVTYTSLLWFEGTTLLASLFACMSFILIYILLLVILGFTQYEKHILLGFLKRMRFMSPA